MRLWNSHFTEQQTLRNGERLYQLYHDCQEEIAARMKEAKSPFM
jgi:hypothetical protein